MLSQRWKGWREALGIEEVVTAARSPWQNPYAERLKQTLPAMALPRSFLAPGQHSVTGGGLDPREPAADHVSGRSPPIPERKSRPAAGIGRATRCELVKRFCNAGSEDYWPITCTSITVQLQDSAPVWPTTRTPLMPLLAAPEKA
jgi:hypothetical protein